MAEPLLEATGLRLSLPDRGRKPLFGPAPVVGILKDLDLSVAAGEALGVVGESGSGKTSLGRTLLRLLEPTGGTIRFAGTDITHLGEQALRPLRPRMQMIFQDPESSLNPRLRVGTSIARPLLAQKSTDRAGTDTRVAGLLDMVGLDPAFARRFPHELSGGQRQRVGIARAIASQPALIVADEIVSGLDMSTQAQILDLLRDLRQRLGLALIFISHDLSVVRALCDRVLVMLNGEIVEAGASADLFARPRHAYTKALLAAVPLPEVDPRWLDDPAPVSDHRGAQGDRFMKIEGCVALVTGANRGIGASYVEALLAAGAAKVYATTRLAEDATAVPSDPRVVHLTLDVTDLVQVAEAAAAAGDVTLLINNAGVNHNSGLIAAGDPALARHEVEVNYLGKLAMCRAFAPVLKANGGGVIVNMLSILGRVMLPLMGSLSASKAAALAMTIGVRAELAKQGTHVIAVMPGAVETRMTDGVPVPKIQASEVTTRVLAAIEAGEEDVLVGQMAEGWAADHARDHKALEKELSAYLPS